MPICSWEALLAVKWFSNLKYLFLNDDSRILIRIQEVSICRSTLICFPSTPWCTSHHCVYLGAWIEASYCSPIGYLSLTKERNSRLSIRCWFNNLQYVLNSFSYDNHMSDSPTSSLPLIQAKSWMFNHIYDVKQNLSYRCQLDNIQYLSERLFKASSHESKYTQSWLVHQGVLGKQMRADLQILTSWILMRMRGSS